MTVTFSVKNFEKFQHYKDRSPPWIRLYNSLLDDYEFGRLPDASKAHLLAIWLLASRYDNKIPYDTEWVSRRINATEPVDLNGLAEAGFIIPDQRCSTLLAEREKDAMPEKRRVEAEKDSLVAPARGANEPLSRMEFGSVFWPEWPHRVSQRAAVESFIIARRKAPLDVIMDGVRRYKATKPPDRQWMNPATFLDEERWTDEPAPIDKPAGKERPHDAIFKALARHAASGSGDDERPAGAPLRVLDQRGPAAGVGSGDIGIPASAHAGRR